MNKIKSYIESRECEFEKDLLDKVFPKGLDLYMPDMDSRGFRERFKDHISTTVSGVLEVVKAEVERLMHNDQMTDDSFCVWCNGHIKNEHHQLTCGNYNQALQDILALLSEAKKK